MIRKASIAALLHDLDERSPAGFAIALHVRFAAPAFLFQTYPKRWMDRYSAKGMVVHDPTVRWGMNNVGRILWRDLEKLDSEGVLEQAKDFGIMNGVTVTVMLDGSRSIASFARADRDYDDHETDHLEQALTRLHRATAGLDSLDPQDMDALKALSVRLTH